MTNELRETSGACAKTGKLAALDAAGWLSFGGRASLRNHGAAHRLKGAGAPVALCSAAHDAAPLSGMTIMYVLMCVFHLAPWLKLIHRRQSKSPPLAMGSANVQGRPV